MSSFDEREKGFERKFAEDEEREFRASARRDRLLGEWAAKLMGLEDVGAYVLSVVRSDLEHHRSEDVAAKVAADLAAAGHPVGEAEVGAKMEEFLGLARAQILAGE